MAARKQTKKVTPLKKTAGSNKPKPRKQSVARSPRPVSTHVSEPVQMAPVPVTRSKGLFKKVFLVLAIILILYLLRGLFVVSIVNGEPIYRFSVINRLEQLGGESIVTELTKRAVVEDELASRGITISEEEIDQEIEEARKLFEAQGVNFEDALAEDNLTLEDVREISRYQKGLRLLAEDGAEDVSDEEASAYYEENKEFYESQTFDEVKDQLKESLKEQNLQMREEALVLELLQNARITTFKAY